MALKTNEEGRSLIDAASTRADDRVRDTVLIVDDDETLSRLVAFELGGEDLETVAAGTGRAALELLEAGGIGTVILDLGLPDTNGHDLLGRIIERWPYVPVVVLTGRDEVDDVVACMRLGAADYVHKPFERTRLITSVRNALQQHRLRRRLETMSDALHGDRHFETFVGDSPALHRALDLLRRVAHSDVSVLVQGESGTGKELAARALHRQSPRRDGPFVAVNCGAIPETLIESELFGHEKGAFTGALQTRLGVFERAEGGTLFLDEIGELRADLQVRLLRVLEERAITRVGGTRSRAVDVRVVAATHRDLEAGFGQGDFREDLYYRLAVFPVTLPSLRERDDDVMLLARHFLVARAHEEKRPELIDFTPDAETALRSHTWRGNVRELRNVITRAVLLEEGPAISLGSLPDDVVCSAFPDRNGASNADAAPHVGAEEQGDVEQASGEITPLADLERDAILRALRVTDGNVQEAARRLGIGRATIYRKLERYELDG